MRRALFAGFLLAALTAYADPSGKKWQVTSPIPYTVFNGGPSNCGSASCNFNNDVLPAVKRGFERWIKAQVGNACPGGGGTSWDSTYSGTFSTPTGLSAVNGSDGVNRVLWLGGTNWTHGATTLGLTTTVFYTSSGQIIDADMELNDDVTWKIGGVTGYQVDVESIVTHEAGHFLGLNHSTPTSAVMYAYYDTTVGEIKRNLTSFDLADVCTVYPGSTSGTGLNQGDPCTMDSQCNASQSLKCRGQPGAMTKICTPECTSNSQCPTGYTCQSSSPAGSTGKACLPPVGSPDLCKFCTAGTQCSTGQCVTNGPQNWCTRTCMTSADCGAGFDCVMGTTSNVCAPKNNACPSAQCSSNKDCAVGYACSGGMCTATGNSGDRCELSAWCNACSTCVLDGTGPNAYCRACCGGSSGTGACQGCNTTSCPSGMACTGLTNSTDQICYPQAGSTSCEACDATTPCQAGYICRDGRCHAACNPSSPGACTACFDTGGGDGICACPGEVAYAGSHCGELATGLAACAQGTLCVGTPKTCRTTCTLSDPNSCPSGESCQNVDGHAVCLPSNVAGQRCSECVNGGCDTGFICVSGRCYEPCDVAAPACLTCVEAAPGVGICACEDQQVAAGYSCGAIAGDVYACQQGLLCIGGTCRRQCNPSSPSCGGGERCTLIGTAAFCEPIPSGNPDAGNTGGPGPGGAKPDAGTGTGGISGGCGCSSGATGVSAWLAAGLFAALASRRRSRAKADARGGVLR